MFEQLAYLAGLLSAYDLRHGAATLLLAAGHDMKVVQETLGLSSITIAAGIPLRANGTRPPLFCVHPAAGVSWVYSGLLRYLEPDRPVYGLQSRRFTHSAAEPGIDEMVAGWLGLAAKLGMFIRVDDLRLWYGTTGGG